MENEVIPYTQVKGDTNSWLGFTRAEGIERLLVDLIRSLRQNQAEQGMAYDSSAKSALAGEFRPQTLTEMLDGQIAFHEKKIADLKEAKDAVSPEVERALNALAKL